MCASRSGSNFYANWKLLPSNVYKASYCILVYIIFSSMAVQKSTKEKSFFLTSHQTYLVWIQMCRINIKNRPFFCIYSSFNNLGLPPFRHTDEHAKQRHDGEHGHHRRRGGCAGSARSSHFTGCLLHQHTPHSGSTLLPHAGQKNNSSDTRFHSLCIRDGPNHYYNDWFKKHVYQTI